jgi:peptide chain release factor 2
MQKINQEKVVLEKEIGDYNFISTKIDDSLMLLDIIEEEDDQDAFAEVKKDLVQVKKQIEQLEVKSFLSEPADLKNCYISINAGAGGTEACDWAGMVTRMFMRFAEAKGFNIEAVTWNDGEEAGVKSVTLGIEGPYAYGLLKAENGVHRLVRVSPFDSNARRHTSFCSVFVWPEVDDDVVIEIRTEDLKVDTYRSSGAGGQHVNRTDSAVRITHMPTGIIVACQSQRSQISNRDKAMKMLKAQLYELELEKRKKEMDALSADKKANEWGSQIRSYVLHPYQLVKDHRTNHETSQTQDVLDGDLEPFIEAFLKSAKHAAT